MKFSIVPLAFVIGVVATAPSRADIVTFTGSTAGGPTYNRLLEDLSALSAVGTSTRYNTRTLTVSAAGTYTFMTTGRYDTFATLYTPSFAPLAPLTNAAIANDDLLTGFTTSGFAYALAPGINYTYVTTGFANSDNGFFSNTFGGPGTISLAPAAPGPTNANVVTFTGNTTAGATFNRPLEDLSALSAVGTGVHYDAFRFRVGTTGLYSFLDTALFDSFMFLYGPTFNPLAPLVNALAGADDLLTGFTTSGFAANLTAGTEYTLVTTAFANTDFGAFSNTIGGPGEIIASVAAVPEPESLVLLLAGLGFVAWASQRRRCAGIR